MVAEVTPKKWKAVILDRLTQSPNVAAACRHARITRKTAYQERIADPEFAIAWEEARQMGLDALEDKAIGRAEKESDTLMIFLLKAHRPERYNVPTNLRHSGDRENPIEVNDASLTTDERVDRLAALLDAARDRRDRRATQGEQSEDD